MNVGSGASIAFWMLAAIAVCSALGVILVRDIFRAALFLVVAFLSVAGLFITLSADFVAMVQVLIYAGAISILLIFALLLTREVQSGNLSNRLQAPGIFLGALVAVTLSVVFLNSQWHLGTGEPLQSTSGAIADALFSKFVLPFEISAVLLLGAILGAIVLASGEED